MKHHLASMILAPLTLAGLSTVFVAGCGSSTPTPAATQSAVTELKVASTSLGTVVTDANGRTLYLFTRDTRGAGTSACTDATCLSIWPPAVAGSSPPRASGVTGAVGTIDVAGKKQVTLNGWPLYYYAPDSAAGDEKGQGVGGQWFVVDAAGNAIRSAGMNPSSTGPSSTNPSSQPAGGGYGY